MAVKYILLRWKRTFSKTTTDTGEPIDNTTTPYIQKDVEANVFIGMQEWISDLFNIPVLTDAQVKALTQTLEGTVKAHDRELLDAVTGTAKTIKVAEGKRTSGLIVPNGKIARLNHPTAKGKTGKPHKIGIGFPSYFKIPMICQALGQMIPETKSPGFAEIEPSYKPYPIIQNDTKGVIGSTSCGAWVVTADAADVNVDETSAPDITKTVQSRRTKG